MGNWCCEKAFEWIGDHKNNEIYVPISFFLKNDIFHFAFNISL